MLEIRYLFRPLARSRFRTDTMVKLPKTIKESKNVFIRSKSFKVSWMWTTS